MSGDIIMEEKNDVEMLEASSTLDDIDKDADELWSIMECIECKNSLNKKTEMYDSKLLTCLHALCGNCFENWEDSVEKMCPVCLMPSKKSETRDNKVLCETLSDIEIPKTDGVVCNIHDALVSHWCMNCAEFICAECVRSHAQLKSTRDHVISTKDEYVRGITLENTKQVFPCSIHPQNQLTIVCHTCRSMTCRDCQLELHRDHKYDFLSDKIVEAKTEIYNFYKKIEYHSIVLTSALEKIKGREEKIEELKQKIIIEVKESSEKIITLIRKRCQDLMLAAVSKANDKISDCKHGTDDLRKDLHLIQHCLRFVKTVLNGSSDPTIFYTKDLMMRHMERVRSNSRVPNAVDVINLKFVPENLDVVKTSIKTFGKLDVNQDHSLPSVDPEYYKNVLSILTTNYSDQLGLSSTNGPSHQQEQQQQQQDIGRLKLEQEQEQHERQIHEQQQKEQQQQQFEQQRQFQQQQKQRMLHMHQQQQQLQMQQAIQQEQHQQQVLQQQQAWLQHKQQNAWQHQNTVYRREPQGHYIPQTQQTISQSAPAISQVSSNVQQNVRNNLYLLAGNSQRMHQHQQQAPQQQLNPHLQRMQQQQNRVQSNMHSFSSMLQQSQQQRMSPQQQRVSPQQLVHSSIPQQQMVMPQDQRVVQQQRVSPLGQHSISPQQQQLQQKRPTPTLVPKHKALPPGITLQSISGMRPPRPLPPQPSVVFYHGNGPDVMSPLSGQQPHHSLSQPRPPPPPYTFQIPVKPGLSAVVEVMRAGLTRSQQSFGLNGLQEGQTWHCPVPNNEPITQREKLPSPSIHDGIKKVKISSQQAQEAELRNQQHIQEQSALKAPSLEAKEVSKIKLPSLPICKQEPEPDPEPELPEDPEENLKVATAMETNHSLPPSALAGEEGFADVLNSLNELNRSLDRVDIASDKQQDEADPNEAWCAVCMDGGNLVCCENCPKVFHNTCHIPQIVTEPERGWRCLLCEPLEPINSTESGQMTPKLHKILCRVLLEMYCQYDSSYHFRQPVPSQMANYYETISEPICLNEIRTKLASNCYNNIVEFVSDVKRMFNNCYLYFEGGHPTVGHGRNLEDFFNSLLNKFMPSEPINIKTEVLDS